VIPLLYNAETPQHALSLQGFAEAIQAITRVFMDCRSRFRATTAKKEQSRMYRFTPSFTKKNFLKIWRNFFKFHA